jgi:hypothetical protein
VQQEQEEAARRNRVKKFSHDRLETMIRMQQLEADVERDERMRVDVAKELYAAQAALEEDGLVGSKSWMHVRRALGLVMEGVNENVQA